MKSQGKIFTLFVYWFSHLQNREWLKSTLETIIGIKWNKMCKNTKYINAYKGSLTSASSCPQLSQRTLIFLKHRSFLTFSLYLPHAPFHELFWLYWTTFNFLHIPFSWNIHFENFDLTPIHPSIPVSGVISFWMLLGLP